MMEIIILCFILIRLSQGVYVQTQYGWVQGVQTEEAIVFYGIPYAKQPKRYAKFNTQLILK